MTPEIKILRSLIREIVRSDSKHSLLREGGKAFPGKVNSVVPRDLLEKNIESALSRAGLSELKYSIVGNISKDYLGDLDIAVDESEIRDLIGIDSTANLWDAIKKYVTKNVEVRVTPGLRVFHILIPLVDENDIQINAFKRNSDTGGVSQINEIGMIQLDILVGDRAWMSDVVSGAPRESTYKAAHRNDLLHAILTTIPLEITESDRELAPPNVKLKKKMILDITKGLITRLYYEKEVVGKSGKILKDPERVIVSQTVDNDSQRISSYFLNTPVNWSEINSYEKLEEKMMSNDFKFKDLRQDIIKTFKNNLARKKLPIPHTLENI